MKISKPELSFWQIWNMNVGFLGIQFSFGLQQTAVNPIFSFLGAHHDELPLLNLAGPVTGLLIQPLIGAVSDKTWSVRWGRRKPFFLIGAILGSLCLFAFPFSPHLWFAVGLLWILDAANNTAMEPYRAFVGDKLPDQQLTYGFQMQSLFVGAGIVAANLSLFFFQDWFGGEASGSAIPRWVYYSFFIGSFASVVSILWSVSKTPEIPPSDAELQEIIAYNKNKPNGFIQIIMAVVSILALPVMLSLVLANFIPILNSSVNLLVIVGLFIAFLWLWILYKVIKKYSHHKLIRVLGELLAPLLETTEAIGRMPNLMWRLSAVYFFQWYALFVYWQFIAPMLRENMGLNEEQALAQTGLMNGIYNGVTMVTALILVPIALKMGNKWVYVVSLFLTSMAMISLPFIHNPYLMVLPMLFLGIGWAAMMGIPYAMVSKVIPQERRGVYMGIVNMMIVIPMLIQTVSFGPIVKNLLNDSAVNAILFAGVFFLLAAVFGLRLKSNKEIRL